MIERAVFEHQHKHVLDEIRLCPVARSEPAYSPRDLRAELPARTDHIGIQQADILGDKIQRPADRIAAAASALVGPLGDTKGEADQPATTRAVGEELAIPTE